MNKGLRTTPRSMPNNQKYRDNYDRIFNMKHEVDNHSANQSGYKQHNDGSGSKKMDLEKCGQTNKSSVSKGNTSKKG